MSRAAEKPVRAVAEVCAAILKDQRTVEEIALQSGVDRNTIWFWIRGETTNPNIAQVDKVARALGFDVGLIPRQTERPMSAPPGYWMNETSGVLRPAVEAYLNHKPMTDAQIAAMRAYLRQWIAGPWAGPRIEELRESVDGLTSRRAIVRWLDLAMDEDIDPL